MLKSIVQSATSGSIKLRYCNYKQINAVSLLIHKASNSNVACNRTLFGSYIGSNLFSTTGIDLSKLSANLDTTSMKIKEEVLTDNDKISAETIENTTPELFENLDFHEITGGDEETLSKFNLLLLEVDVLRQDGVKVPKSMSTDQWKELFALKSRSQRLKFLKYLWTIDMKKLSDKRKKEDRKVKYLEKRFQQDLENSTNEHIKYGFQGSTIFIRIYETSINLHYNNKLVQAMKFGQNIVIDCGYETDMSNMENKLCAKQLSLLFAENRKDREPFNVHFCNINREGVLFNQLKKLIPTIDEPHFPVNVTENHYLDLFPKEKLVYLTPHCRTELLNFNHDDVYIVGKFFYALILFNHSFDDCVWLL